MSEVVQHVTSRPTIELSDSALKHLLSCLAKHPDHSGVRFSVKKTGCSGLSYVVDYVKNPYEGDLSLVLADNYLIYIDPKSYPFLKNMQVDYQRQGLNFKLVFTNPNQTGQCGCGESFTID